MWVKGGAWPSPWALCAGDGTALPCDESSPCTHARCAGGQGCIGALRIVSDALVICLQDGCKAIDVTDPVRGAGGWARLRTCACSLCGPLECRPGITRPARAPALQMPARCRKPSGKSSTAWCLSSSLTCELSCCDRMCCSHNRLRLEAAASRGTGKPCGTALVQHGRIDCLAASLGALLTSLLIVLCCFPLSRSHAGLCVGIEGLGSELKPRSAALMMVG